MKNKPIKSKEKKFDSDIKEVKIALDEESANAIYNVMKALLSSGAIKPEEFEIRCKHCDKEIFMRNLGFGWRPVEKNGAKHSCKQGVKAYKKIHDFDEDDN